MGTKSHVIAVAQHAVSPFAIFLELTGEQSTVIVTCEGEVQYEGSNSHWEIFSHHFVLKKIGDVWKIVNDTFRVIPQS